MLDARGEPLLYGQALRNLALAYAAAGDLVQAIDAAEEALPFLELTKDARAELLRTDVVAWKSQFDAGANG